MNPIAARVTGIQHIGLPTNDLKQTIEFYKSLGFEIREDLSVSKPEYDFCCFFMCQGVRKLRTRKKEFLKNYNKPKEKAEAPAAV